MALKKDISRIQIGGDGKISFGGDKEELIDLYRKNEENAKNQSNFLTESLKTVGDPMMAIKNGTVMQQSLRGKAQNSQTAGNQTGFSLSGTMPARDDEEMMRNLYRERGKETQKQTEQNIEELRNSKSFLTKTAGNVGYNLMQADAKIADTLVNIGAGIEGFGKGLMKTVSPYPQLTIDKSGKVQIDADGGKTINEKVKGDVKTVANSTAKEYHDEVMKPKLADRIRESYLESPAYISDDDTKYNKWEKRIYNASGSSAAMVPGMVVGMATGELLGAGTVPEEVTGALGKYGKVGKAIGKIVNNASGREMGSFVSMWTNAFDDSIRQRTEEMEAINAALEEQGKKPKYTEADMIRKSTGASLLSAAVEAVGEYMIGGVLGIGPGIADTLLKNAGVDLSQAIKNPFAKGIVDKFLSAPGEGNEEVVQNAGEFLIDKYFMGFDDAKFDVHDAVESWWVGTIMGWMGNIPGVVSDTAQGVSMLNETKAWNSAVDKIMSTGDAAKMTALVQARIEANNDYIEKADEYEKAHEAENTDGIERTRNIAEYENGIFEKLINKIAEKSDEAKKAEDAQEAAKNAAEGAEPFRVRNWVEERQNGPIGQKMKELGVTNVIVDDALTYNDKRTGMIHIAEGTDTEEAADISMGHEVAHLAIAGDKTFVSDMKEAMRGIGMDVEALRQKAKDTYRVGLSYEAGMTKEEAERLANDDAYADEEIVSEFIGEMNRDGSLIEKIANEKPNVLRKVYDTVVDLVDRLTGKDAQQRRYQRLAEKIRRALKKIGYDISGKTGGFTETETEGRQFRLSNTEDMNVPAYGEQEEYKYIWKTPQFKKWFGKSALVNDDGTPKVFYHQTTKDFTVFNTDNPLAGKNDSETPNGIFFKTNDHDIGLSDNDANTKQMAVYLRAENVLKFTNRKEANKWYCENVPGYESMQNEMNSKIRPLDNKMDEIENEMFADGITDEEYDRLDSQWNSMLEEMHEIETDYRGRLRDMLTDLFIKNDSGYDAIELDFDGQRRVNGKLEKVHTVIVFSPNQVKSATDNVGTFDAENPDIRYRMKSTEDMNVKSYAEQDREYAEAVESGDTEKQKQLVKEAAKAAGYDSPILYHGTPNGTFNVFRNWNYFTENKEYAEVYQGQGASSNGYKKTANRKRVYQLYANLGKVFDTRKAKERRIFQNEFFGKWGNGTPLSERGIPDWTDADDLIEFFEEKGYNYDTILLDEGKTGGYGEEIRDRGISYLIKNSRQLKSAEPVEYDDDRNVIPLSERFNSEEDDIRYRLKSTEDNGAKSYADQRARQLAAEAGIDIDELRNELGMNEKPKERKKRPRSTTSNRAIQEKFAQDIRLEQMMNRKDWNEMTPVEREFAEQKERRFWEQSGYTLLHPETEDDAMTAKLMHDFDSGLWGNPSSLEAGIRMWEIMAKSGYKPAQETLDSLRKTRAAKIAEQRMTEAQKEAAERPAREAEEYRKSIPLPTVDTTVDGEPAIDTTFGEADQPQTWQERLKAEEEIAEREIAYDKVQKEAAAEWAKERAQELADKMGIAMQTAAQAGIPAEPLTDEMGENIIPEKEQTAKTDAAEIRNEYAQRKIIDATREYDSIRSAIQTYAETRRDREISKARREAHDRITYAVNKAMPSGTAAQAQEIKEGKANVRKLKTAADFANEKLKRARKAAKEIWNGDLYTKYLEASPEKRAEIESKYSDFKTLAKAEKDYADAKNAAKVRTKFTSKFRETMWGLSRMIEADGVEVFNRDAASYNAALTYLSAAASEAEAKAGADYTGIFAKFAEADAEERAKMLDALPDDAKRDTRDLYKLMRVYGTLEAEVEALENAEADANSRWTEYADSQIKNSGKLKKLEDTIKTYQNESDVSTYAAYGGIEEKAAKDRKTADALNSDVTDADILLAQTFLDTVEEMTDAEREAENIVRAQIVAGNIISRDVISSMAETEESALNRMDEYRRMRDAEAMRIPEGLEKAAEQYKDSGYTEAEAILLAKRDARQEERKARIAETAMGRLGYKITGAIRDNYADAADLIDRKNKERNTMKTIRSYIKSNGIAPALETMAKDIALKKMMISETGLSGAQLTQVRALSTLYEDYYSYVDGGIGTQGKSIAYDMVNRIDEIFDGFDWKKLKKVNQFLLNASNPQRIFEYVFGRGETADELRRTFIDPVIQNEAEKNRMDNRMIGKLNKYKITKAESGLVQAFAELRNIENTNPTSKGKEREKVFTSDVLRRILSGKTDVRKLVAELETANAFGEWANTDEGKQYLEDLKNGAVRESEADDTVSSSEEAYDELLQCLLDAQNEARATAKTAALDDYLKNGGTKDAWNNLPEAERNRLISEKQEAEAETKARTLERAADDMRNLLNNMYEALNEISVIHGRGEIKYRKDYMPHRQPEEARTKLEEMLRLYGFEPVSELPAEIAGQTETRKPNARWLPFAQERTGYKTTYDALGNVSNYIRIANSAIYHMDDIIKLRNLDVYLRTKFSKGEKNYKRSIYEQLYQNGLAVDDQAVADMLGNKVDDTNLSPLVVWLTEYANDLAGKQVLRGSVEKTFGRKALNLIAKNLQHSSAVMLAGNLSSSVKQISQMPKVFADTVKQTPKAIKAAFGKSGDVYDVAGRSTVLNEIEKQENISYFGEKSGIADKAAEIGSAANFFFNNMMNRYAVYAYFEQAMENGMDAEDAIAEADRKTRAIMSSRMKGATPLLWRSKNPFVQLATTFQRETVAQWENLLNESKDIREYYEKNGKDKTVSIVSKKLAAQLGAVFLFNSAMQAAGVGTPAMFDVIGIAKNLIAKGGGVLWSILAAAFKEATDDDDDKLLSAEELIDAAAAGVENDLAIVKDEIADDIPFVNVVNTILGTAFGYDVTTNLPIQSVELGKFKTVGKNLKMLEEFRDELENATDADVIAEIERERADERTALALNLLTGVTDIAGSFVTAGNQLRKTVNGIAAILTGGEYSRGGKAGELKYAIDDPADAVKAVLFGKSATKAAQEYFDSDYKTLSETNTDAYRNAMKNGAKSKEALNVVKEVSAAQKTDGKTEKQVKAGIILQSNLPDDAKASLYFDMVASGSQQTAIAAAQADGFDKDIDVVKAVNSVYNASLTGGKLEKVTTLLNTGLSGGTMKDIYLSMIDSKKTLDDGTVTTYDTEKINALADAGIGFRSFLEIEQKYKEIDNEDVSASVKAAKLMNWALGDGYSRKQTDVISDTLTYSSGFRANTDKYEELIDAGVTPDHAVEVRTALTGLSTQNEKIGALLDLGYRQEETVNALKTIMTEKKYDSMVEALGEGVTLSDYYEFYEAVDADGNGSISNEERITVLNGMNLTAKQKSALWKASGGSDKSNPYKSGIGSSGTFGASGTFGSGETFGTSGTFGKTGTFGNGGTFKAGGTFGK